MPSIDITAQTVPRDERGRWLPGVGGNPAGNPNARKQMTAQLYQGLLKAYGRPVEVSTVRAKVPGVAEEIVIDLGEGPQQLGDVILTALLATSPKAFFELLQASLPTKLDIDTEEGSPLSGVLEVIAQSVASNPVARLQHEERERAKLALDRG